MFLIFDLPVKNSEISNRINILLEQENLIKEISLDFPLVNKCSFLNLYRNYRLV